MSIGDFFWGFNFCKYRVMNVKNPGQIRTLVGRNLKFGIASPPFKHAIEKQSVFRGKKDRPWPIAFVDEILAIVIMIGFHNV